MTRPSLVLLLTLAPFSTFAQQPGAATGPIHSPEVHPDRRVTFRLPAPKAAEVLLRGDFLKSREVLRKDEKGLWAVTVGPIEPDIYAYEFLVDGVRTVDPNNPSVKNSSLPMQTSSWLEVPGQSPMFYDTRQVPHGAMQIRWYRSKSLDSERRLYIYTPPDYERVTARYPVLYLLHGAGGDDSVWLALGRVNMILDNLIADHKIAPLVVVMPFGYAFSPNAPPEGLADVQQSQRAGFERDLIGDVIPYVQANYRVNTSRNERGIAGLSMGGGQALTIGLHHPELFSRVAGFSAGLQQRNLKETFQDVVANPKKVNDEFKTIWFSCGTDDRLFAVNQEFSNLLTKNGITHTFRPMTGDHTWQVWRRSLFEVSPLLFPQTRERAALKAPDRERKTIP
ncbi:MAG: esterase [Acidobacteriia bacterium]|nr:esterase [Terriglobia bacterium]